MIEEPLQASPPLLENQGSIEMEPQAKRSNIVSFYQNRSVLITGGSGFIGKVLIEKLLRTCPGVNHVFVLIRPKWNKQPHERLQELLKVPLFDGVRSEHLQRKVIVVEGDVTQPNLGLSEQNLLKVMNEVSVIFHSAATVKFDEPLKQSIGINIAGTKNMVELCRKIPQLAALVHVSTAYANCDRDQIDEHVYPVDMNPEKLIELANWLDQDILQELKMKLLGARPNTYTYTKALAEWFLVKYARDLPVAVCRPSIVCASWKEPFSGWIDNFNGPTGIILGAGKGLIRTMFAEKSFKGDLVPVDTCINLVITLGWFAHVYHNQKQLNDTTESLTESLLGSDSMSMSESFDDFSSQHHHENYLDKVNTQDEDLTQPNLASDNDNNNNGNDSNNNNNNNNNSQTRDKPTYHDSNNSIIHLSITDEGYGSSPQSSETKSTASSSSLIISSPPNTSSTTTSESVQICHANSNNYIQQTVTGAGEDQRRLLSFVAQRRLDEQNHAAFEYKLKQFRHNTQVKLAAKNLPEEIADIPVFHCTSGAENPITWGRIQVLILTFLCVYPSSSVYRYPCGSFTNNKFLDAFYSLTLHYIPGYIVDFVTQLFGGKPIIVKIFKKFEQAAKVLKAFTSRQWDFKPDNSLMLLDELMSDEDRRLFNFDLRNLDWEEFLRDYVLGVRRFLLKEDLSNIQQARTNLKQVYYRNLSLQVLCTALAIYTILPWFYNITTIA